MAAVVAGNVKEDRGVAGMEWREKGCLGRRGAMNQKVQEQEIELRDGIRYTVQGSKVRGWVENGDKWFYPRRLQREVFRLAHDIP